MRNYKSLAENLKIYVNAKAEWGLAHSIPEHMNIYNFEDYEILIPAESFYETKQGISILNDSVATIAKVERISIDDAFDLLSEIAFDVICVHESGSLVEHGKINFKDGIDSLQGIYNLIKSNVKKTVTSKGKKRITDQYMEGVNLLAPQAGSFIYRAEIELHDIEPTNEDTQSVTNMMTIARSTNIKFANKLNRLQKNLTSNNTVSISEIYRLGIDKDFCNYFLNIFSQKTDNVSFKFNWSLKEKKPENTPNEILFTRQHRKSIESISKQLESANTKRYEKLPCFIEQYSWPIDSDIGVVKFKVLIDGKKYSARAELDSDIFEKLKSTFKHQEMLYIDAEILLIEKNKKTHEIISLEKYYAEEEFKTLRLL